MKNAAKTIFHKKEDIMGYELFEKKFILKGKDLIQIM